MSSPIDRIENVRAQVDDVERQMDACRVAGVQFSPSMTWQLLSACKSLLGPTLATEKAKVHAEVYPMIRDMVDPDPCWFDHHGGCQAHGYLSLKPGEKCPHAEAKEWLAENNDQETTDDHA